MFMLHWDILFCNSMSRNQLKVGSVVNVPNNRSGILKYIGQVDNKPGTFVGIELINGDKGRNNGDYNGKHYFQVETLNSGIFYTLDTILLCNGSGINDRGVATTRGTNSRQSLSSTGHRNPVASNGNGASKNKRLSLDSRVEMNTNRRSFSTTLAPSVEKGAVVTPRNLDLASQINTLNAKQKTLVNEKTMLTAQLNNYKRQLDEKVLMMQEYAMAVEEMKPQLAQYASQLEKKDAKIIKTKQLADQQRDELREAISALEDQASENAEIYTNEVQQLNLKIEELHIIIVDLKQENLRRGGSEESLTVKSRVAEMAEVVRDLQGKVEERDMVIESLNSRDEFSFMSGNKDDQLMNLSQELELNEAETKNLMKELGKKNQIIQDLAGEIEQLKQEVKSITAAQISGKDTESQLLEMSDYYEAELSKRNVEISELVRLMNELESSGNEQLEVEIQRQDKYIAELKQQLEHSKEALSGDNSNRNISEVNELQRLKDLEIQKLKDALSRKEEQIKQLEVQSHFSETHIEEMNQRNLIIQARDQEIIKLKAHGEEKQVLEKRLHAKDDALQRSVALVESLKKNASIGQDQSQSIKLEAELEKSRKEIESLTGAVENLKLEHEDKVAENRDLIAESALTEELHEAELKGKDVQIQDLLDKLEKAKAKKNGSLSSFEVDAVFSPDPSKRLSNSSIEEEDVTTKKTTTGGKSTSTLRYSSSPEIVKGQLPIYKPATTVDASKGRSKWCGLCEREGHDSYDCPYET